MPERPRSLVRRYGVAVAAVAVALLLKALLSSVLNVDIPFLLFFATVALSAWYGGLGPGLLATALAALSIDYLLLPPFNEFGNDTSSQTLRSEEHTSELQSH